MTVAEQLAELNPDALLLEPRDVYDTALIGVTTEPDDHWPRKQPIAVAVYDEDMCLEAIMKWMGCDDEAATEWFCFNTSGAWCGENTPTFTRSSDG
jgi:hypothetical protein